MKNVNVERALKMVENKEWKTMETSSLLKSGLVLDIILSNGEKISFIHKNKSIICKERMAILISKDGKVYDAVYIKSNDDEFDYIMNVFSKVINNNFEGDYSKFF